MRQPIPRTAPDVARSRGVGPGGVLRRILALVLAAIAVYLAALFPTSPLILASFLLAYLVVCMRFADAWLIIVPVLLPLLYLAPWSGRIFFDEFDLVLLCTLATALWHDRLSFRSLQIRGASQTILILFTALYLHAIWRGLAFTGELDFNAFASYYSPLNAVRIGKGYLWALALYPAWAAARQRDRARSDRLLATGLTLGMLGVSVIVLWERGVLHDIVFYQDRYTLIGSLLNFSTPYRITALFADMHTGGEAIDGYLTLVLPFAAMILLTASNRMTALFGATVTLATLYAMAVTFSRGVYFGLGISLVAAFGLGAVRYAERLSLRLLVLSALGIASTVAMAVLAFRSGGVPAIAASIAAFATGTAYAFATERGRRSALLSGIAVAGVLACAAIGAYAAATSKWTQIGRPTGMSVSAFSCILFALIAAGLNRSWNRVVRIRTRALVSLLTCATIAVFVPSLFGSRMEQRFSTATGDMQQRIDHWTDAVQTMDKNLSTRLLGQGVGRFPERYYWNKQEAKDVGSFVFLEEDANTFLRFAGAKDVRLGQRMTLQPNQDYTLSLRFRTGDPEAKLHLRICHRHLIHPTEWNPACVDLTRRVTNTDGAWKSLEFTFNSANLDTLKMNLLAPLVLELGNRREYDLELKPQTFLDFDNLSLRVAGQDKELMRNGDFENGIDNWFGYYDFNHLPWHIKNLWVNVYFELGIAGTISFVLLLITAFRGLLAQSSEGNASKSSFAVAVMLALTGFLAVGAFGTMLDIPRVTFLFFLLLLSGLTSDSQRRPGASRSMTGAALDR